MAQSDPPQEREGEISLDIPLPPPSVDQFGRKHPWYVQLKQWANFIATVAALFIGTVATLKPQDQKVNKASYEELKKAIEQSVENDKKNHEDIVALRNYLEGYLKGMGYSQPSFTSVPVSLSGSPSSGPFMKSWPKVGVESVSPPSPAPPPLPVLNTPKAHPIPSFDEVLKK